MAINTDGLYRTNASGKIVIVDGQPMLEASNGSQSSLADIVARYEGKNVRIDVVDTTKEKGRVRAQYGSQPR